MDIFMILGLIAAVTLFLVGIAGLFLPIVPSLPIVWIGIFLYGALTGFEEINQSVLIYTGVITLAFTLLDFVATALGAKAYGSSWRGALGAMIGGVVGFVVLSVPGLIIGSAAGAFALEYFNHADKERALKAMWGSMIGFLFGTALKLIAAIWMIVIFVRAVF